MQLPRWDVQILVPGHCTGVVTGLLGYPQEDDMGWDGKCLVLFAIQGTCTRRRISLIAIELRY